MCDATPGLSDYQSSAMRAVLVGGIVVALGAAIGVASREVAEWIGTLGATAALVGVVGLLRVWRIRRRVVRDGWRVRGARFRVADSRWGSNGQPALLLEASDEEPEAILSVSTTVFRWEAFHEADVLWVVGDPRSRFAAVATTDGEHVVVVKRPWSPWWGNRLRKIVTQ